MAKNYVGPNISCIGDWEFGEKSDSSAKNILDPEEVMIREKMIALQKEEFVIFRHMEYGESFDEARLHEIEAERKEIQMKCKHRLTGVCFHSNQCHVCLKNLTPIEHIHKCGHSIRPVMLCKDCNCTCHGIPKYLDWKEGHDANQIDGVCQYDCYFCWDEKNREEREG
jgi:hypothetical protein